MYELALFHVWFQVRVVYVVSLFVGQEKKDKNLEREAGT